MEATTVSLRVMIADRLGSTLRWEYAALLHSAAGSIRGCGPVRTGRAECFIQPTEREGGNAMKFDQWQGFAPGAWQESINVRDFIQKNYTPYTGDGQFLCGPTPRTSALMAKLNSLFAGGFGLASPESIMDKVCPACGYHFQQFRSNGLLGCDQCYDSFREELRPVIRRIQGSVIDKPDVPAEEAKASPEDKLKALKEELNKAVAAEEYERAAQLRDQIRAEEESKK